jgi:hypothetical protein
MENQSEKLDHQVAGLPSLCLASSRIQFSVHTTIGRSLKRGLSSGLGETIADSCSRAPMANRWTPTHSANLFVGLS